MKKSFTLLLLLFSMQLFAQTGIIVGINIVLPANPDAITANWANGSLPFTVTANTKPANGRMDNQVLQSRLLMVIKRGGVIFCSNHTSSSAPLANFSTAQKTWSGKEAVSFLGKSCELPPGDYQLCVQFFANNAKGIFAVSEEACKSFSIIGQGKRTGVIIKERPGEPTNKAIKQ